MGTRSWSLFRLLCCGVLIAAACQAQGPNSPPAGQSVHDQFTIAVTSLGNEALDPIKGPNDNGRYLRLMFDSLVGVDIKGETLSKENGVARDWQVSPDGKTYTFTIRQGVKFSNGDDLTAEDVKFSLDRLKGKGVLTTLGGDFQKLIAGTSVLGPYQLEVRLSEPRSTFLYMLSPLFDSGSSLVVPKKYFESVGEDGFAQKPIGSGPYKLVERQVGSFMRFEPAFPEHFGFGKPRFKSVILRLVPEESTRLAMLTSGAADFIDVGIDKAAQLKADHFRIFQHEALQPLVVFFQLQRQGEPTRDLNLRKALSYAINRDELNASLLQGLGQVTGNMFIGQVGGKPLAADPYDPAKAKEFLDMTDYGKNGKKLVLQFQVQPRDGWPQMLTIASAIQDFWRKIGVDSVITYRDFGAFRADWAAGTLPAPAAIVINWAGRLDWYSVISSAYSCAATLKSVCDPELEKLTGAWKAASTTEEYEKLAVATEKYMRDNYIYIGILAAGLFFAGNEQVRTDYSPGYMQQNFNERGLLWQ